jgi:hypothetical protein
MYVINSKLQCDFQNLDSLDVKGFFDSGYQNCVKSVVQSVCVNSVVHSVHVNSVIHSVCVNSVVHSVCVNGVVHSVCVT